MPLAEYRKKRDFKASPEPKGKKATTKRRALAFVIQKHQATRLHYDFRLEWDGVLKSWAIPKGPSLDPSTKRLAVEVEDHPIEYGEFEGVIPEGNYGGGTVMIWDRGTWVPEADVEEGLRDGVLKFSLKGRKLHGSWALVRTKRGPAGSQKNSWLLIKHRDDHASTADIAEEKPRSVVSKRLLSQIAEAGGGNVEKAAKADPSES
jgi:bifunctional non-homologous end joining protein LigD